jgi:hypothetical protein
MVYVPWGWDQRLVNFEIELSCQSFSSILRKRRNGAAVRRDIGTLRDKTKFAKPKFEKLGELRFLQVDIMID